MGIWNFYVRSYEYECTRRGGVNTVNSQQLLLLLVAQIFGGGDTRKESGKSIMCFHDLLPQPAAGRRRRLYYFSSVLRVQHVKLVLLVAAAFLLLGVIQADSTGTCTAHQNGDATIDYIDIPMKLSVQDRTRHWSYENEDYHRSFAARRILHPSDEGGSTAYRVARINNARSRNYNLTLDTAGFEFIDRLPTSLTLPDFYKIATGDKETRARYVKELQDFATDRLGCHRVVVNETVVRNRASSLTSVQSYTDKACPHLDATAPYADLQALDNADDHKLYRRYLSFNIWRNIADYPIQENHLALLDDRTTVKPDDYIGRDKFDSTQSIEDYMLSARHADSHMWYYFPNMTKEEALILKISDSDWTVGARSAFHTGFLDPVVRTEQPRQSIEARMFCYWKKQDGLLDSMPTPENTSRHRLQDPDVMADRARAAFLEDATVYDLAKALWTKLLLGLGRFLGYGNSADAPVDVKYSGKPQDYFCRFLKALEEFPTWSPNGVEYVKNYMERAESVEEGIAIVTRQLLVDDYMNSKGTKYFSSQEKDQISLFLVEDYEYKSLARHYWGRFRGS